MEVKVKSLLVLKFSNFFLRFSKSLTSKFFQSSSVFIKGHCVKDQDCQALLLYTRAILRESIPVQPNSEVLSGHRKCEHFVLSHLEVGLPIFRIPILTPLNIAGVEPAEQQVLIDHLIIVIPIILMHTDPP